MQHSHFTTILQRLNWSLWQSLQKSFRTIIVLGIVEPFWDTSDASTRFLHQNLYDALWRNFPKTLKMGIFITLPFLQNSKCVIHHFNSHISFFRERYCSTKVRTSDSCSSCGQLSENGKLFWESLELAGAETAKNLPVTHCGTFLNFCCWGCKLKLCFVKFGIC